MRVPRLAAVAAALVVTGLAAVPLAPRAQAPGSPPPTVWGVDADALLKVDAPTATLLVEVAGGGGHALAVDPAREVVWTYQGAELRA